MYKAHVAARDPANALGMFLQVLNDHQQALEWLQVRHLWMDWAVRCAGCG
jgi:hypothetical protein